MQWLPLATRPLLTACFTLVFLASPWCCAQTAPQVVDATVGFDGICKAGFWTPIAVDVRGGDADWRGRLLIETSDSDGVPVIYEDDRIRAISAGQTARWFGYAKLGRRQTEIRLRLEPQDPDQGAAAHQLLLAGARRARPAMQRMFVTLGDSLGIQQALDRRRRSERERNLTVRLDDASRLPDRALGYDGVNVLAVATSRAGLVETLQPEQLEAITQWVRNGGRMILSAGTRAAEVLGPEGPLRDFAPGAVARVELQEDTSNLESFVKARQQLPPFQMAMLDNARGVLVEDLRVRDRLEQSRPLILRNPLGLGDVVFVACDLDQPPFSDWVGRSGLVDAILRLRSGRIQTDADETPTQYEYSDLSAQLRTAMDQFRDAAGNVQVATVFFSLVVILVAGYALLIGPGDYWLLRSLLGRRMLATWFTFPAMIVAACVLVLWLNQRWKGDQVRVTQVDVIDIDAESGWTRSAALAHVFTPRAGLLDLTFQTRLPAELREEGRRTLAWQGVPGTALGGLDSATLPLFEQSYRVLAGDGREAAVQGIPAATGGSRSFIAQWNGEAELGRPSYLFDSNGRLDGELVNPLNVELTDCILMYGNWSYRLDAALAPGQAIPVAALTPRDLEWRLTRRRVAREDASFQMTPWDAGDQDVARILEIIMFHGAAGGESYTQLPSEYLSRLDLSRLLRSGRAILMGRTPGYGASLYSDSTNLTELAENRVVFCRIVMPVEARPRAGTRDNIRP